MNTHEYRAYFDQHGPDFAEQQPPTRRERVVANLYPLGELGLVGAAANQEHAAAQQPPFNPEQ